jgi:hypothetical protein
MFPAPAANRVQALDEKYRSPTNDLYNSASPGEMASAFASLVILREKGRPQRGGQGRVPRPQQHADDSLPAPRIGVTF